MPTLDQALLAAGIKELEDSGVESGPAAEFGELISSGSDISLFRVNPLQYASTHDLGDSEAIDLFLVATKVGLFRMEWNIVCNSCGNVYRSFRNLAKVDSHFHCNLCDMENESNLDDVIQVVFTVDPTVREVVFNHPEALSLEQRLFDFHYSASARTHVGEQATVDFLREFTVFLQYLEAGESVDVDVDLDEGSLLVRDWTTSLSFFVAYPEEPTAKAFEVTIGANGIEHKGIPTSQVPIDTPVGTLLLPAVHGVGPGSIHLTVTNNTADRRPLWMVRYPSFFVSEFLSGIESSGPLTAKRLVNTASFRSLFRSEAPGEGEGLTVTDLTYVFTDLKGSTLMYDEIGDATAYNLVQGHFAVIRQVAAENNGVVIKTIGDAVMATFISPVDALSAAIQMVGEVTNDSDQLQLKVGVHRGFSMAVNLNDQLDYFGQNVNIAARTQQLAGASEILVTQDVVDSDGIADLLADAEVEPVSSEMKGVTEEIPVFRITP